MKKFLNFWTSSHFYSAVIALILSTFLLIINYADLSTSHLYGYILFIGLCLHQLEEYRFPGGFTWGYNTIMKSNDPLHFPGNRISSSTVGIVALIASGYFLLWHYTPMVASAFAIFAMIEVVVHIYFGIVLYNKYKNKGKETIYVPGSFTSWLFFAPVGGALIYQLMKEDTLSPMDWLMSGVYILIYVLVFVLLLDFLFRNPNTQYIYKNRPEGYFKKFLD